MTKKSYNVMDVIKSEITLEPMKCLKCKKIGYTQYHQYIGDAMCEMCGTWQLDYLKKKKLKKVL